MGFIILIIIGVVVYFIYEDNKVKRDQEQQHVVEAEKLRTQTSQQKELAKMQVQELYDIQREMMNTPAVVKFIEEIEAEIALCSDIATIEISGFDVTIRTYTPPASKFEYAHEGQVSVHSILALNTKDQAALLNLILRRQPNLPNLIYHYDYYPDGWEKAPNGNGPGWRPIGNSVERKSRDMTEVLSAYPDPERYIELHKLYNESNKIFYYKNGK